MWADDSHLTTLFLQVNAEQACYQIAQNVIPRLASDWLSAVQGVETAVWQQIDNHLSADYANAALSLPKGYTDFMAVMDTVSMTPANGRLFLGNSLPIRHLDQFARPSQTPLHVYANRGASGIDGNISTALGFGAASNSPLVAVLGDITFYHDMNGLLAVAGCEMQVAGKETPPAARHAPPTTIVVLNNNGGGIFRRLPISQIEPPFTDLFLTPHNLDFEHAARLYNLDFVRVTNQAEFRQALGESLYNPGATLIEVVTNGRSDHEAWRKVIAQTKGT
ncbi:MAG: thiamine pyrophosphate-dependent enzyme [Chloroflexi bacterium]|nr:thiamine pyrophosphate-dependent enzyme [Chloroflexota bacterium]